MGLRRDAVDDLHVPLGFGRPTSVPRVVPWRLIGFAGLGVLAASLYAFIRLTEAPRGGDRAVLVRIEPSRPAPAPRPVAVPADTTATIAAPTPGATAADLERDSGVKVVRPAGADMPGALIISVPQALAMHLAPAPDVRVVEKTRYGLLPKIGAGGLRPADLYARPVHMAAGLPAGAPRIAILVGGLGLNRATTQAAIALPGAVSVAFAAYGGDLDRAAAEARRAGHELLLQVPMEPYDGGGDPPGPHMLRAGASGTDNVDQLRWALGRFAGYVGVANFQGAKFTASETALAPVLHEIADRGLLYADDGSSARSLVPSLAARYSVPLTKADIVIDASPRPEAIDAALARLETLAREKGLAVATASALPSSIERVAAFASGLEARGIALVPLSAATDGIRAAPIVEKSP